MPTSLTDTGSGSLNIEGLYHAARAIMILSTPVFFIISVMSPLLLRREHCCLWVMAINHWATTKIGSLRIGVISTKVPYQMI